MAYALPEEPSFAAEPWTSELDKALAGCVGQDPDEILIELRELMKKDLIDTLRAMGDAMHELDELGTDLVAARVADAFMVYLSVSTQARALSAFCRTCYFTTEEQRFILEAAEIAKSAHDTIALV